LVNRGKTKKKQIRREKRKCLAYWGLLINKLIQQQTKRHHTRKVNDIKVSKATRVKRTIKIKITIKKKKSQPTPQRTRAEEETRNFKRKEKKEKLPKATERGRGNTITNNRPASCKKLLHKKKKRKKNEAKKTEATKGQAMKTGGKYKKTKGNLKSKNKPYRTNTRFTQKVGTKKIQIQREIKKNNGDKEITKKRKKDVKTSTTKPN